MNIKDKNISKVLWIVLITILSVIVILTWTSCNIQRGSINDFEYSSRNMVVDTIIFEGDTLIIKLHATQNKTSLGTKE